MKIELPDTLSDEQFRAIDKSTGTPVSGYAYFIIAESGESISGYTDNNGKTQRIETEDESSVEVFWGEDALERMSRS